MLPVMNKLTPILLAALACSLSPAVAQTSKASGAAETALPKTITDPEAAVRALYAEEQAARSSLAMTRRLESLFMLERDYLEASGHPFDRLDFDWTVNGQDARVTALTFETIDVPMRDYGDAAVDQFDRKIVHVAFRNFDSPTTIRYYWIKERSGWKLDDVTGDSDDGTTWTLSLLLAYGG